MRCSNVNQKGNLHKTWGFDPDYFAYFEDLDLCWRAWLYGYKIMHIPNSIIFHKFGWLLGF